MWKSILLCVSLFGGAALGLGLGARFVEPAAVPAAAAIGLCVIGVVLILAAPAAEQTIETEETEIALPTTTTANVEPIEVPTVAIANRTPTLPFEAVNP